MTHCVKRNSVNTFSFQFVSCLPLVFPVESPVGVGFSYSDNPDVDYNTDDNKTALDNYRFLVEFFKNFPEYKNHDFYIA